MSVEHLLDSRSRKLFQVDHGQGLGSCGRFDWLSNIRGRHFGLRLSRHRLGGSGLRRFPAGFSAPAVLAAGAFVLAAPALVVAVAESADVEGTTATFSAWPQPEAVTHDPVNNKETIKQRPQRRIVKSDRIQSVDGHRTITPMPQHTLFETEI